jgi:hypothetical protein
MTLQAGTMLNYTLRVNGTELEITSVAVTPWASEDKGSYDLEIFKDAVPDPYVEWARIQHVDGTLYTADQWLAAEAAGTVTDADANGVAVRYSKYAVCPHVIHPTISTSSLRWSSNDSIIPGISVIDNYNSLLTDVNGKANTDAILAAVTAETIPDAPAAQYCDGVTFANGQKGYLPAGGEITAWPHNKNAIDACMIAIGGTTLNQDKPQFLYFWTSSQIDYIYPIYFYVLSDDGFNYASREIDYHVRAVSSFTYNP